MRSRHRRGRAQAGCRSGRGPCQDFDPGPARPAREPSARTAQRRRHAARRPRATDAELGAGRGGCAKRFRGPAPRPGSPALHRVGANGARWPASRSGRRMASGGKATPGLTSRLRRHALGARMCAQDSPNRMSRYIMTRPLSSHAPGLHGRMRHAEGCGARMTTSWET